MNNYWAILSVIVPAIIVVISDFISLPLIGSKVYKFAISSIGIGLGMHFYNILIRLMENKIPSFFMIFLGNVIIISGFIIAQSSKRVKSK